MCGFYIYTELFASSHSITSSCSNWMSFICFSCLIGLEVKWTSLNHIRIYDPMDYMSVKFCRPEYYSGELFTSLGDLPNSRIEPRSSLLHTDFLPAEPPGSPRILGSVAYPFSSGSSQPRNWTGVSGMAGKFFTRWATRESQLVWKVLLFQLNNF